MLTHTKNSTLKLAKEILLQVPVHITYPKMTLFWLISSCLKIMNIVASVSFMCKSFQQTKGIHPMAPFIYT